MKKNKWTLEVRDNYTIGEQTITRTNEMAIPPTNGDRTDILDEDGNYHYNMTKAKFMEKMTPEEYLEDCLPGLEGKEKEKALKNIEWTPRKRSGHIAIIIDIKQGEITLKYK
jgi:hypothetical protein